ncbi:MAG: IclR family transcriptional regulator [Bacillota bacterium]
MTKKEDRFYAVHSVERALSILEALGANPEGTGVTRLGKELGLHKSTVHRLLNTLMKYGFVEQDEATERYRLGMRFISLGLSFLHQLDFRREVLPYLKELAEITGETTQLGVLEGSEVLYLERCQSQETITVNLGLKAPAHCAAEGKVLLAYLPEDRLREYFQTQTLRQFTINTIVNPEQLLLHIERVRAQGYAVSAEELADSLRGLAAPIMDVHGRVVAAVGIVGPASRLTLERINRLIIVLQESCHSVSLHLGYRAGSGGGRLREEPRPEFLKGGRY